MSSEIEAFETHMDRMERERQAQHAELEKVRITQEHQTKRAKLEARNATKETLTWIVLIIAVATVVLGIIFFIWKGTAGPSADQVLEDKWRSECLAASGTWIPDPEGYENHMCLSPGAERPIIMGQ